MDQSKSRASNSSCDDTLNNKPDPLTQSCSSARSDPTYGNAPGSPKVQFSVGTKERDGHTRGVRRTGKRAFRNIVWREIIGTDTESRRYRSGSMASSAAPSADSSAAASKRGILKLREAVPSHKSKESEKQSLCFVNQAYIGDDDDTATGEEAIHTSTTVTPLSPHCSVSATHRSALPFDNRRSSENVFASVVELLFQRGSLDFGKRDMHPFGRDSSVEATIQGSGTTKTQNMSSAFSKLVLWITLLSFLVGAAVGVIFLSETYNAKHRQDELLKADMNESQNMTS